MLTLQNNCVFNITITQVHYEKVVVIMVNEEVWSLKKYNEMVITYQI